MKRRVGYRLEAELLDEVEETSEGLIIEYTDDFNNKVLKMEKRNKKQKGEDWNDYIE